MIFQISYVSNILFGSPSAPVFAPERLLGRAVVLRAFTFMEDIAAGFMKQCELLLFHFPDYDYKADDFHRLK
jgi:hypothetical protein